MGAKVRDQIQEGLACCTKAPGALLLVMNNQELCLREKVQTEATFSQKSVLFHLYKVFFKYWNSLPTSKNKEISSGFSASKKYIYRERESNAEPTFPGGNNC